jgi:hypothetical protein
VQAVYQVLGQTQPFGKIKSTLGFNRGRFIELLIIEIGVIIKLALAR